MTGRSQADKNADPSDRVRELEAENAALRWLIEHQITVGVSNSGRYYAWWKDPNHCHGLTPVRTKYFRSLKDSIDDAVYDVVKRLQ